ncbi:juvenile hormone esterase-like isoform X1 [Metopolophium dirhodum]|uniref:juvenile hormone esterase-like isoform X1 n=2 Tax=Metopolophium dirhodum TaxID=44670 RepID=UPI00298F8659|nr:juvenile hormone esterase-like isoform X1 [Metopolophium dirhodum]XP_060878023.1 juvenile hormone esterase-like isoform X1 [Metopolophium dirhodum]XP_060878024.1 juvenile hormone esterase-like isoform X1 [Metopolophium dirhodum]
MRCIYIVWILFLKLVCCELEVRIADGILKGQVLQSRDGRTYYSYTGIPYARPPIGELRFKAPQPVEPWNGKLDASRESNKICIQNNVADSHEDCLYLNVFTPKVDKKFLPVMFWIHGGMFSRGRGGPGIHGPEYFMDKDVLLVTINYRLGVLGFLSTEDDVIPGNYGMKDQVMALRWVQKNIIHFNGDPSQVTIFGESTGGASTGFHMLSPMSKGLFHKVILQSGSPVCKWAVSPIGLPRKRAHAVALIAGCNFDTSEDILQCLRKLSADYIIDLQNRLYAWLSHPCIQFNPVVENCDSGQEAFLCHHPIYDFKQESFVPAIVGLNSAEGGLFVASLYNSTSLMYTEFQTYFNRILSIMLFYYQYTRPEDLDEIGERVLKEYFPSGRLDDNTHSNAVNMIGDGCFTHCIVDMAKKLSSPVYSYYYDYQNEFSYNKLFGSCQKSLGVTHADELNSLFKNSNLNPNDLNADDLKVSRLMVNIWYRFAISETPTIDGTDTGTAWPKFTYDEQFSVLHIDSAQPKIIQNPFDEKYKFWNQLPYNFRLNQTMSRKIADIKTEL